MLTVDISDGVPLYTIYIQRPGGEPTNREPHPYTVVSDGDVWGHGEVLHRQTDGDLTLIHRILGACTGAT